MGVGIETQVWQLNPTVFLFLYLASFLSIFLFPHLSRKTTSSLSNHSSASSSSSVSFLHFQRKFIFLYSLSSVLEGLWLVDGEYQMVNDGGLTKQQIATVLSAGCLASFVFNSFFGIFSDVLGHKKFCLLFSILHLITGVWNTLAAHPAIWLASLCLSLASSIFSFSFEAWMVVEHDKQGYRQDALNETFWLLSFSESASMIGSQVLANWAINHSPMASFVSPSIISVLLAVVNIAFIVKTDTESPPKGKLKEHRAAFSAYIFRDKRIWLLGCAQACLHFSVAVFWLLWAPTLVADGREVQLGLIYPCLLGARMLGSTAFPWSLSGLLSLRIEDCLLYEFISAGVIVAIIAYDYQEIGVFVTLFCLFEAVVGLILPTLARLRSMFVPNEFRAGMESLSLAPANVAIFLVLFQGGFYGGVNNSTRLFIVALGLFLAAGCMHMLKTLGKQPNQNWHKR
ncbi:uncharacterized protein LOC141633070 isoform X2 [Silene latifolia]|uniref:uncharacterized protein LOC141633070 isoform X2 n=1 Tax=Silene latifolia TaxID=37657 RepID=UPI003D772248